MSILDKNSLALAARAGGTGADLISASMPDPFMNTGKAFMFPESAHAVNRAMVNLDLGAPENSSTVSNFFSTVAPAYIDFVIRNGSVPGHIENLNLIFNLTVANAAVQLLPTYMWFDRLDIYFNNSTQNGETYNTKYELASDVLSTVDKLHIDTWAPYHNADPTTLGAAAALNPGTYEFILSLKATVLSSMKVNPQSLNGDIRIRLFPSAFAGLSISGLVANVVMNRMTLNANVNYLNQQDAVARATFLRNTMTVYPISSWTTYMSPASYALVAGQPIRFPINTSPGLVSGLLVFAQQAQPTGAQFNTGVNLDDAQFALYDATNQPIQQRLTGRYLKTDAVVEKNADVLFARNTAIDLYPVAWSGTAKGIVDGGLDGQIFMDFNGTQLEIIPGTSDAGPYIIYVIIMYKKLAKLVKGQVEIGQ